GEESPQRIIAVPLTVRGRAVAVLYADSAGLDSESINLEALETLVTVAGMAVEMLSVARAAAAPKRAPLEEAAPAPTPAPAAVEAVPFEPAPQSAYVPTSEYEAAPEPAPEPAFSEAETLPSYDSQPVESGSLMDSGVAEEATTPVYEATEASSVIGEEPPAW